MRVDGKQGDENSRINDGYKWRINIRIGHRWQVREVFCAT